MDLWQLTVFCKVVELESFSKAGNAVYLSQPTVSSHIKELEADVGCRLIDRFPKKASPTRAGELLYGYAKKLLNLRDEAEAALAELQGAVKGRVAVGGSTIPGVYLLPRVVGSFTRAYPQVTVALVIGDSARVVSGILSGELELGVVGSDAEDDGISQELLFRDEMRLVVSANHRWAGLKGVLPEELQTEPFIVRETGSGTLKSMQRGFENGRIPLRKLNITAEMGSTEAVRQAILADAGVSILSMTAVAEDIRLGRLVALPIQGVALTQEFYLTWQKHRTLSPLGAKFKTFLKENMDIRGSLSSLATRIPPPA